MLNELIDWFGNQGFAILVAGFLLLRLETKVDKLISLMERVVERG